MTTLADRKRALREEIYARVKARVGRMSLEAARKYGLQASARLMDELTTAKLEEWLGLLEAKDAS